MAVESAADRAAFVSTDDFATAATYATPGGSSASLTGVFDDPHLPVIMGERVASSDRRPTFWCQSADLPNDAAGGNVGDTLTVGGTTYKVADHEPDGQGMTLLILGRS